LLPPQLGNEAALADPRLAGDQDAHDTTFELGATKRSAERRQLPRPTDERLRRRRVDRAGQPVDEEDVRPADVVEGYRQ